jgi:hypothetical protein
MGVDALVAGDPAAVGRYRLLGRLGAGGMGTVYLGRSPGGRLVAVKCVHPHLAREPEYRQRFARESAAALRVGGFHTAQVVDTDPYADPPWLVTAYIPGPSLEQAVAEHGPLPETSLRRIGAGLAEALQAIHGVGLVHRDLKPSNVLLADDGPRVIDFGIARGSDDTVLTRPHVVVGTPGFMAPEQISGGPVGPACDVFSLGRVLCDAAGAAPYGTGAPAVVLYRVVHEEPDLSGVPRGLRAVLRACLAADPADRPTPADLVRDFDPGPQAADEPWLPPSHRHRPEPPVPPAPAAGQDGPAGPNGQSARNAPAGPDGLRDGAADEDVRDAAEIAAAARDRHAGPDDPRDGLRHEAAAGDVRDAAEIAAARTAHGGQGGAGEPADAAREDPERPQARQAPGQDAGRAARQASGRAARPVRDGSVTALAQDAPAAPPAVAAPEEHGPAADRFGQDPSTAAPAPTSFFGPAPPPFEGAGAVKAVKPRRKGRRALVVALAVLVVAGVGTAVPLLLAHDDATGAAAPDCLAKNTIGKDDPVGNDGTQDGKLPAVLPADTPHPPAPTTPVDKQTYLKGERVTLRWKAAGKVSRISLNHDGKGWKEYGWQATQSCSFVPAETGSYQWEVSTAAAKSGAVGSAWSQARYLSVLTSAGAPNPVGALADPPDSLSPADLAHVPLGKPVTLTWTTPAAQSDVVIQSPDGKWSIKPWQSGRSYTFTPNQRGHYVWSVFAAAKQGDRPGASGQQRYLVVD